MKIIVLIILFLTSINLICEQHPWPMSFHDTKNTRRIQSSGPRGLYLEWCSNEKSNFILLSKEGIIYSGDYNNLYGLNSLNGELLWKFSTNYENDGSCSYPALSENGKIYYKCNKKLYALDGTNGNIIWEKPLNYSGDETLKIDSQNVLYLRDVVDIQNWLERIIAIDGNTGQEILSKTFNNFPFGKNPVFAISEDGNLYFSGYYDTARIYALDKNGNFLWEKEGLSCYTKAFVLGNNSILYCSSPYYHYLVAINGLNGEIIWQIPPEEKKSNIFRPPPASPANPPICGEDGSLFYFMEKNLVVINEINGQIIKSYPFSENCNLEASSQDNLIYLSYDNYLYCFDSEIQNVIFKYPLPFKPENLILGKDKEIYISSDYGICSLKEGKGFTYPNLYFIPVSAHKTGANGTFWKTDLFLTNPSSNDAEIGISLFKSGEDNRNFDHSLIELKSGKSITLEDVYSNLSGIEGTGSILIQSNIDNLIISSRTYNFTSSGTYGQYVKSFRDSELLKINNEGIISPLIQNNLFRTNIGISSLSELETEIEIEFYSQNGDLIGSKNLKILPLSHIQINEVLKEFGDNFENCYLKLKSLSTGAKYFAYASIIDSKTGDAIFIPASQ